MKRSDTPENGREEDEEWDGDDSYSHRSLTSSVSEDDKLGGSLTLAGDGGAIGAVEADRYVLGSRADGHVAALASPQKSSPSSAEASGSVDSTDSPFARRTSGTRFSLYSRHHRDSSSSISSKVAAAVFQSSAGQSVRNIAARGISSATAVDTGAAVSDNNFVTMKSSSEKLAS